MRHSLLIKGRAGRQGGKVAAKPLRVVPNWYDTYRAIVKNSVGTRMFRTLVASVDGVQRDILRRGDLSCAFYVSSVLLLAHLLKSAHGTVDGTVRDLVASGWKKIRTPRPGSVLVWEAVRSPRSGESHAHIGFFVGGGRAVSNDSRTGMIRAHHWTYGVKNGKARRRVIGVYEPPMRAGM